ncbi:hypothetical protein [Acidithiobacillus albertensis]|uniref:hypothetical protein n=1 Tax=Acidithiobacillus albertensis TaxID=119978 RepID=UPI00094AA647|nr:hypothetical protein [Acidithiobacillus albertensis]
MAQHHTGLMNYHTIADAFLPVNDDATKKAMGEAKEAIGDAEWKKGFSNEKRDQIRAILKENGVSYDTKVSGKLMGVDHAATKDNEGNTYNKLRVFLEGEQGKTILSLDMNQDFTQRLIPKLDTATQEHAGKDVTVIAFAKEELGTDGKMHGQYAASLKDQDGQEIKAPDVHREKTAEIAANVKTQYPDNKKAQKFNRDDAREKYFTEVTEGLHNRMVEQGIAPTQAEKKGPLPGHEANLLSAERGANDEEKWYSLRVYPDKEGNLLATLTAQEDKNLISRQSKLEVKDGKDGGLVIRGDGFGAKIGEDRQVQFFEGKNKTPIQGKSKNTALLHPAKGTDITSPGMKNLQKILDTRLGQGKDRNVGKEV